MNGEGHQTEDGTDRLDDDNVVRLPRDWLGPPEDLIPIGPRADARRREEQVAPTAEDFWSETSAAVQDALPAPHHAHEDQRQVGAPHRLKPGRAAARAVWSRRRAWARAASPALATRAPHSDPAGRRRAVAAVGALAGTLLAVVLILPAGNAPQARLGRSYASALGAAPAHGAAVGSRVLLVAPRSRGVHAGVKAAHTARSVRHNAGAGKGGSSSTATAEAVGYTTTASSAASGTSGYSSSATPTAPAPSPSPTTSNSASSGAGSAQAFGASGSLGPGSSPDG